MASLVRARAESPFRLSRLCEPFVLDVGAGRTFVIQLPTDLSCSLGIRSEIILVLICVEFCTSGGFIRKSQSQLLFIIHLGCGSCLCLSITSAS